MKKNPTTLKLVAATAMVFASMGATFAQTNLGAECGCPSPVSSRPTILMSSLPGFNNTTKELTTGANLICTNTYILDQKIYVPSGQILTIAPGTVVKGRADGGNPANASALVIEKGGRIIASGEEQCPIVFTAEADNLDGSFPIANKGQWGGVLIAGKASNNLTLAANGPFTVGVAGKLAVADGIGTFEGFQSTDSRDQFGVPPAQFDDNDNSGIMKYVSIRYAGSVLVLGGEINALTLGSVGRGTTLEHIEVVSCADDGIEFFGGTVNIKYVSMLFGNDDMFDWDLGWSGKAQFLYGLKTDNTASTDADNGFECDADDQKSNNTPRSHPIIYNATIVGNNKTTLTSDNSCLAAINAKELTEGEIYNSVLANFKVGFNMSKALSGRAGTSEAYHNWSVANGNGSQSLKVKCNTFVGTTDALTVDKLAANVVAADNTQFTTTDLNVVVAGNTVPGFNYTLAINNTSNAITTQPDVIPNPALSVSGCPTAPVDGFFIPAAYRGAFASTGQSWLSGWTYATVLHVTAGLQPCPTDINGDGITNNNDFLQLVGQFNQSCQ